ncbi:hypothetical protein GALL_339980 [mine drainage metagenome]|uniref:DUF3017 domain-containing protein n=1 Tax=mine drainage metagenome TaxID=410659 RepID=A0A1J5R394_9ZZZZ
MTEEPGQEPLDAEARLVPDAAPAGRHAAPSSPTPGDEPLADPDVADADLADPELADLPDVVIGPGLLDDVPPEQLEDPRAIARASLIAGRNASLWWVCAGVVVVVLLSIFVSAWAGATTMALLLAIGAVVRILVPAPGPAAFTVRSRTVDVTVLLLLAVGVGILAQLIPER